MDNGGGNGAGCFEVEIWADTAKFTNVIVAGFRKCRDLVREGKVFIKDKAKVASRVGCSERRVVYFRKLLFKSDKKKLSFRTVESKKVCSLSVCLLARLLKNAYMDLNEILRVDRCRDMDELINFRARSGS